MTPRAESRHPSLAEVVAVAAGGQAEEAGIKPGCLVTAVNGTTVANTAETLEALQIVQMMGKVTRGLP